MSARRKTRRVPFIPIRVRTTVGGCLGQDVDHAIASLSRVNRGALFSSRASLLRDPIMIRTAVVAQVTQNRRARSTAVVHDPTASEISLQLAGDEHERFPAEFDGAFAGTVCVDCRRRHCCNRGEPPEGLFGVACGVKYARSTWLALGALGDERATRGSKLCVYARTKSRDSL